MSTVSPESISLSPANLERVGFPLTAFLPPIKPRAERSSLIGYETQQTVQTAWHSFLTVRGHGNCSSSRAACTL
jgi:hypothetical protein